MKLKNLIIICLAVVMGLTVIGCDQESDVGGNENISNIIDNAAKSTVAIGFNINVKLPPFNGDNNSIKAAYHDEVTSDWITDATMDIIDAVWIIYHDGTADNNTNTKFAPAEKKILKDNYDRTGTIVAGIASKDLVSQNGLTLDIRLVKYQQEYDDTVPENKKAVYYLGNLRDYIKIDQKIELGYHETFDVTVDGIYSLVGMSLPVPQD